MAQPFTAKLAHDLTAKVAAMSTDECTARVDEIVTTPGSGDDTTLILELTKCIWGPDADPPRFPPRSRPPTIRTSTRRSPRSGSRRRPASIRRGALFRCSLPDGRFDPSSLPVTDNSCGKHVVSIVNSDTSSLLLAHRALPLLRITTKPDISLQSVVKLSCRNQMINDCERVR